MENYNRRDFLKYAAALGASASLALTGCSGSGSTDEANQKDIYDTTPQRPLEERVIDPRIKSVAFIIDTSESMRHEVDGARKIQSAKNCLLKTLEEYQAYYQKNGKLEAGLFCFTGSETVSNPVPISSFDYNTLTQQVNGLEAKTNTPLGIALAYAERELDKRAKGEKTIVLLTDGYSNIGEDPISVFKNIIRVNQKTQDSPTKLYVIAFDVNKDVFDGLEGLGAKVMQADNEQELMGILNKNTKEILAEDPNQELPPLKH